MLHSVAAAAEGPVLRLLIFFLIVTAFLTGSVISEFIIKRLRKYSVSEFIQRLNECGWEDINTLIKSSGFTAVQKRAFTEIIKASDMPEAMRTETAQSMLTEVESHYSHIINCTEIVVKIAPMLGLMGTLIPLGPGIMALGQGDMETLSQSIITAFDTTVVGLISAGFASVISSIRKIWYKKYVEDTESVIETILEKSNKKETV